MVHEVLSGQKRSSWHELGTASLFNLPQHSNPNPRQWESSRPSSSNMMNGHGLTPYCGWSWCVCVCVLHSSEFRRHLCCYTPKLMDRLSTQAGIKVSTANKSTAFDPFSSSIFRSFSLFSNNLCLWFCCFSLFKVGNRNSNCVMALEDKMITNALCVCFRPHCTPHPHQQRLVNLFGGISVVIVTTFSL